MRGRPARAARVVCIASPTRLSNLLGAGAPAAPRDRACKGCDLRACSSCCQGDRLCLACVLFLLPTRSALPRSHNFYPRWEQTVTHGLAHGRSSPAAGGGQRCRGERVSCKCRAFKPWIAGRAACLVCLQRARRGRAAAEQARAACAGRGAERARSPGRAAALRGQHEHVVCVRGGRVAHHGPQGAPPC